MATQTNTSKGLLTVVVIVILSLLAYAVLTMPDRRTGAEKLGDAISELPNGADKAARQLEDRTPGQKLGDAVEDAGENAGNTIRRNTQESPND